MNYEVWGTSFCRMRTSITGVAEETIEIVLIDLYTSDRNHQRIQKLAQFPKY